jgi:hypothetical protein
MREPLDETLWKAEIEEFGSGIELVTESGEDLLSAALIDLRLGCLASRIEMVNISAGKWG